MAIKPFNWRCPYCDHAVVITSELFSSDIHKTSITNAVGSICLSSQFIICPNRACRKPTLNAQIRRWSWGGEGGGGVVFEGEPFDRWRLMPFGESRVFPDYVPAPIREDYQEACLIRDLSPKAAATLARRTLQGILRDFFKVTPGRLVDEINALEATMAPELLEAIHGVRKVGNIGAHMEKDIDLIVDVDPDEAQLLIELVETMIEETYVHREQRRARIQKVTELAGSKEQARKALAAPAAQGALPAPDAKPES
jgi:hypothetical protein